jgi:cobalt-zinc-cadmium efflux system membrane fusion protein
MNPRFRRALVLVTLTMVAAPACRRATQESKSGELAAESATNWTDTTELFVEHPPLIAGQTVRFAVHLTTLKDFQALNAGKPSVELRAKDGSTATMAGTPPLRPGAFRVEGVAPAAGEYTWALRIDAPGLSDRHEMGPITVFPDEKAARVAVKSETEAPTIAYLKEQQWTNEFGTTIVQQRPVRDAVRAPAVIEAIPGGEAVIGAPADGRVAPGPVFNIGTRVTAGQVLARFEPRLAAIEDRATLVREIAEAKAATEAAQTERDRADRLLAERAVPARRVEEALRGLTVAQAQLQAAETRLAQRDQTLNRGGAGNAFVLRSPIAGRIVEIKATPGASFEEGADLFRIVRTDRVTVEASVSAADSARVREITAAEIELPGDPNPVPLMLRRINNPEVIDPESHALPLHLEIDNPGGHLLVGQAGTAVLYTRATRHMPVVPRTALLTEGGRPILFVQVGGESFDKRRIEVGPRDGDYVGIRSGLKQGERVVTRGMYDVLLASAAKGLPAEGHVH